MQGFSVSRPWGTKLQDEHDNRNDRLQLVWQGLEVAYFDMMAQFFLHTQRSATLSLCGGLNVDDSRWRIRKLI
jgi:hypothetical protein